MLRIDSTVTDTPIHAPSDSSLPWDSVRFLPMLDRHIKHYGKPPRLMVVMPVWRFYTRPRHARSPM